VVDSPAELAALVKVLSKASTISFDTGDHSTDEMTAGLVGISLAVASGQGYYIPVGHKAGAQLPLEQVLSALSIPMTDAAYPRLAIT